MLETEKKHTASKLWIHRFYYKETIVIKNLLQYIKLLTKDGKAGWLSGNKNNLTRVF